MSLGCLILPCDRTLRQLPSGPSDRLRCGDGPGARVSQHTLTTSASDRAHSSLRDLTKAVHSVTEDGGSAPTISRSWFPSSASCFSPTFTALYATSGSSLNACAGTAAKLSFTELCSE